MFFQTILRLLSPSIAGFLVAEIQPGGPTGSSLKGAQVAAAHVHQGCLSWLCDAGNLDMDPGTELG